MAELEVEEQSPAEANAIEHFGEDVHAADANPADDQTQYSDDWALTSENSPYYFMSRRADASCGNPFRQTADGRTATLPKRLPIPRTRVVRHPNRSNQCEIFYSQPPPSSWPERHLPPPPNRLELPKGAAHNIVLVHGAFVDQTSWKPVADILTKKGYNVTLVENPLTSLAADVDATKQALAKQNGKTVLVGHSWGGVVITQAGNDPKVSALVYVSAFAPDVGQSLATLAKSGPATEGAAAIHPDDKGQPLHRSQGVSFGGRG